MAVMQVRRAEPLVLHVDAVMGTFELLYRPEVDLRTGEIRAMSGLLRHHADRGQALVVDLRDAPQDAPVRHWALAAAAAECAAWQRSGLPSRLWVNVSAAQVREPRWADEVAAVVARHALPDGALGLVLSAPDVDALGGQAPVLLHELRSARVALAVDQVVSWSMPALDALPLDTVKLAPELVRALGSTSQRSLGAVSIHAQHGQGRCVVASGVQVQGEAQLLAEIGCDRAGGALFGSEQRADKARWLLAQGSGWRGAP